MATQSKYVQVVIGSGAWISEANATGAPDGSCASGINDQDLSIFGFQGDVFTLPGGSIITGIEVVVTCSADDSDDDFGIMLVDGAANPTAEKMGSNSAGTTCANAVAAAALGSSSDDWSPGQAWTVAHLNSTSFHVHLHQEKSGKQGITYADSIYVTIHYTVGGTDYFESPDEVVALADSQYKSMTVPYNESTSVTEFMVKSMTNLFTEAATLFFDIGTRTFAEYFANVYNAVTFTDYRTMTLQNIYDQSISVSDVWQSKADYVRLFTESTSIVHYFIHICTKYVTGFAALSLPDSLVYTSTFYNVLTNSVALVDSRLMGITTIYSEALSLVNYYEHLCTKYLLRFETIAVSGYLIQLFNASISEPITLLDTYLLSWTAYQLLIESLTSTDYLTSTIAQLIEILQAVTLIDSISTLSTSFYTVIETQSLSDIISPAWTAYTSLIDTLDAVDFWNYSMAGILTQLLTELVDISDYIVYVNSTIISLSDPLALVDMMVLSISKIYVNALTIIDTLSYVNTWKRILIDSPSITDYLSKTMATLYTETASLLDTLNIPIVGKLSQLLVEIVNITHYTSLGMQQSLYNIFTVTDSLASSIVGIVEIVTRFIRLKFIGG